MIALFWDRNWLIFAPSGGVEAGRITFEVLKRHFRYFGPFPESYLAAGEKVVEILIQIMEEAPERTPFSMASSKEIAPEDRDFVCRIMKLDLTERPSARELLRDPWFVER